MARMYSRAKGKSKSAKPLKRLQHTWLRYSKEEIEQLILKFAKTGKNKSEIGIILRDSYGIPDVWVVLGKKMGSFLKENSLQKELPDDLIRLVQRDIQLMKHMQQHKHDQTAKRGLLITESKIGKLVKYYKAHGILPGSWKYDKEQAQLLVG